MLLIYNFLVRFYLILIVIASFVNKKAKKWIQGRRQQNVLPCRNSLWFHFASLGEFEQGRPVLEALKPLVKCPIVITFFSPSGYEAKKNTPLADYVYYLPIDNATNVAQFINKIDPVAVIFTKYEYWYHYFNELHKKQIPLFIISGIFRPSQIFFKWYGTLHRTILSFVTHFFVQDDASDKLLGSIGINNVSVSGDTRFDRVWQNSKAPQKLGNVENFKDSKPIFVAGSTWPDDEKLIAALITHYPDWKFIFAPHEISEGKINHLLHLLPKEQTIRYSNIEFAGEAMIKQSRVLIIDNVGMLSSVYQYGSVAYIGGGFGVGIHNTLEAAAFGLPVIFGPNYRKFKEACDFVELRLGFCITNQEELNLIAENLIGNETLRNETSVKIKAYVDEHTGATGKILKFIAGSVKFPVS